MFVALGRLMEADLDLIVPMLIKKSAESNGFICDEANKALQVRTFPRHPCQSLARRVAPSR